MTRDDQEASKQEFYDGLLGRGQGDPEHVQPPWIEVVKDDDDAMLEYLAKDKKLPHKLKDEDVF